MATVIGPKKEGVLYHYTSQRVIHSIVEKQCLWVSHVYYMNDANEIKYGARLFKTILKNKIKHETIAQVKGFITELRDRMDHLMQNPHYLFVFSLSEKGNLLSQWRGYTPLGAGVSIGFNQNSLEKHAQSTCFSLIKCIYNKEAQEEHLNSLLKEIVGQFKSESDSGICQ